MRKIVILVVCLLLGEGVLLIILPFLYRQFAQSIYTGVLFLIPFIIGISFLVYALLAQTEKVIEQNAKKQSAQLCQQLLAERQGSLKAEREELLHLIDTLQAGNDVLALPIESYQRYCPHPLTDAILRHKILQFKKEGIDCTVSAAIPSALGIEDTTLLAVLINLLDNAGQAAKNAIQTTAKRPVQISIKLFCKAGHLVIKVINPALQGPTIGKSTKTDPGHGFGLSIIEQTCKENGGSYIAEFDQSTHLCKSTAILQIKEVPSV